MPQQDLLQATSQLSTPELKDFVLFLAEDAQKYPEKLVPFTADMLAEAKALIEGVALD
jgi:hypothetical protein